jgi:hypothetical protein
MAACEAVYYAAHRFGVAGEAVSAPQKDLMHDRVGVGSAAHVELAWPAQPAHVWRGVTGSATLLQFRGAGRKLALTAAGGLRRFKK